MLSKRFPARFYASLSGNETVRDWLKQDLSDQDRLRIGRDIKTAEVGWPLGMPLVRSLKDGLWEIRTDLGEGRIARVIFCAHEGEMILLQGLIKKTQTMPKADLDLARRRKKDVQSE